MLCFRNGPWFKSEGAGQLFISAIMGRQLIPFVMNHDRVKIGQPPGLPQKIVGWGRSWAGRLASQESPQLQHEKTGSARRTGCASSRLTTPPKRTGAGR
jgi:hypothetical protein